MPDDKIVQDGYLLKEEPEPNMGLGLRHHSAGGDGVKPTQVIQEWEGGGRTHTCLLPYFTLGPKSNFPVEGCLAATPLFTCCLILFSSSTIK